MAVFESVDFDIYNKKDNSRILSKRNAPCWGAYTKEYYINQYKNHKAILYISEYTYLKRNKTNKDGVIKFVPCRSRCEKFDSIKDYEKFITDTYEVIESFGYPIKLIREVNFDLTSANNFESQDFKHDVIKENVLTSPIVKVDTIEIDLSKCHSIMDAKQALFLSRQLCYINNIRRMKLFFDIKKYLHNDLSDWILFQLTEFMYLRGLCAGEGPSSEYNFFSRMNPGNNYFFPKLQEDPDEFRKMFSIKGEDLLDQYIRNQIDIEEYFHIFPGCGYNYMNTNLVNKTKEVVKLMGANKDPELIKQLLLQIFDIFKNGEKD